MIHMKNNFYFQELQNEYKEYVFKYILLFCIS